MASLNPRNGVLGNTLAAHLLRRCTYHITKDRIDEFAGYTADQAVDKLFQLSEATEPRPLNEYGEDWLLDFNLIWNREAKRRRYVRSWWLHEAKLDPSIGHRLMFFLHSNFTLTYATHISAFFYDYFHLLRFYVKGSFKDLAQKITTDNVMLVYLNNRQNNKDEPNENYAREFLELFTIGKGPQNGSGNYTNYTEGDIIEAAKLLTGFKGIPAGERNSNLDPDTGIPRGKSDFAQHDVTDKKFSDAFNGKTISGATDEDDMWRELNDFVNMVFEQDATAQNICRKLYRYFVHRDITEEIETDIIEPLANILKDNEYNLEPTLKQLLKSKHFYDDDGDGKDEIVGGLIRSPMELAFCALNFFDIEAPDPRTESSYHYLRFYLRWFAETFCKSAGQDCFLPPNVSGYPAYYQEPNYDENWFTSSTIIARYKLPEMLLSGRTILGSNAYFWKKNQAPLDTVKWVDRHISNPSDADIVVNELLEYMLPKVVSEERRNYFLAIFLANLSPINWMFGWQEYKETNDDSSVKGHLDTLVKTIMYSQEFQTF